MCVKRAPPVFYSSFHAMRCWTILVLAVLVACETAFAAGTTASSSGRPLLFKRRRGDNTTRRVRSRLAKSCGGEVGSVLLEKWYEHCQLVFTASVDAIDRDEGTLNVTLRRVIRSSSSSTAATNWTLPDELNVSSNSLEGISKPSLKLYGLFAARQNSCVPQFRIRIHDVLLFLVRQPDSEGKLQLVSAPLRITLRNLRLIHTSPTGKTGGIL